VTFGIQKQIYAVSHLYFDYIHKLIDTDTAGDHASNCSIAKAAPPRAARVSVIKALGMPRR